MSTSIRYLTADQPPPPPPPPPPRSSSRQHNHSLSGTPSESPASSRPGYDLDQHMRIFMAEKARSSSSATSANIYYTSPKVGTRTDVWRAGNPTPPSSNSPVESPQRRTPQLVYQRSGKYSDPWQQQQQQQSQSQSQSQHSRSNSREIITAGRRSRANTLERAATPADSRSLRYDDSMSPPPTPPAKDDHLQASARRQVGYIDSFPLPPPSTSMGLNSSNSLQRQNAPSLRIAVAPSKDEMAEKRPGVLLRRSPEKKVLETGNIENKQPVTGRSAADEFVSNIAKRFQFGRKNTSQDTSPLSTSRSALTPTPTSANEYQDNAPIKGYYAPWSGDAASSYPSRSEPPADLPGPTSELEGPSPRDKETQPELERPRSKSRSRSKRSRKLDKELPPPLSSEGVYANMPLPAVPPTGASTTRNVPENGTPDEEVYANMPPSTAHPAARNQLAKKIPKNEKLEEDIYANMPLPAVPPTATLPKDPAARSRLEIKIPENEVMDEADSKKARRMTGGAFSPKYGSEMADWAESFFQPLSTTRPETSTHMAAAPKVDASSRASVLNPEGAVRGFAYQPFTHTQSSSRGPPISALPPRVSLTPFIGDSFQYDATLVTIGEDLTAAAAAATTTTYGTRFDYPDSGDEEQHKEEEEGWRGRRTRYLKGGNSELEAIFCIKSSELEPLPVLQKPQEPQSPEKLLPVAYGSVF